MRFRMIADARKGKGSRDVQQDNICVSEGGERGLLAVLSDGIGGMEDGELFSAIAIREMTDAFESDDPSADLCARLEAAYQRARRAALEFSRTRQVDGGATVVAVLIRNNRCAFLSAGDSKLYLFRRGAPIQLNREQTFGKMLDELAALGRIPREEARNNIYRKAITNNLAEAKEYPCDVCARPFRLQAGDKIALMSDGIFEALDDGEIAGLLPGPANACAQRIIDAVQRRNLPRQDNYSAIVISVEGYRRSKNR